MAKLEFVIVEKIYEMCNTQSLSYEVFDDQWDAERDIIQMEECFPATAESNDHKIYEVVLRPREIKLLKAMGILKEVDRFGVRKAVMDKKLAGTEKNFMEAVEEDLENATRAKSSFYMARNSQERVKAILDYTKAASRYDDPEPADEELETADA